MPDEGNLLARTLTATIPPSAGLANGPAGVTATLAEPRGAIQNWTEYVVVLGLHGLARRTPARMLLGMARGLSRLSRRALPGRCRSASLRIRTCLGLRPGDKRVDEILSGAFKTLALNAVEPIVFERLLEAGRSPDEFVTVEGREHLDRAYASGKPLLLCSGHLGAWELLTLVVGHRYGPGWAMARPLSNPLLEPYLAARRRRFVRGTVSKDGGGLKVARIMRDCEPLGLLLDQNAGSKGKILDFLGLPASHHTVAGVMAQRFGALAIAIYLLREEGTLRYRLIVEPPITADPDLPAEEAQLDVVLKLSRSLERQVRAHPEQWLWLHDRWRHALHVLGRKPPGPAPADTQVPVAQGTNGA
jgi:KDO2-lipid IV(A) lauroyltransferase